MYIHVTQHKYVTYVSNTYIQRVHPTHIMVCYLTHMVLPNMYHHVPNTYDVTQHVCSCYPTYMSCQDYTCCPTHIITMCVGHRFRGPICVG